MDKFPFLGSSHTSLIEKMYEDYLKDSSSVHKQWRDFFQGYNFAKEVYNEDDIPSALRKEFKVIDLIEAYRKRGHLFTKTNPVRERRKYSPNLDFRNFQLIDTDLEKEYNELKTKFKDKSNVYVVNHVDLQNLLIN